MDDIYARDQGTLSNVVNYMMNLIKTSPIKAQADIFQINVDPSILDLILKLETDLYTGRQN